MESSIEAGNLWNVWIMLVESFHELDTGGQMFWVVRAEPMQFPDEFASDTLRIFEFGSAMDDTVANPDHAIESEIFFQPFDYEIAAGAVVGCFQEKLL